MEANNNQSWKYEVASVDKTQNYLGKIFSTINGLILGKPR